MLKLWVLLLLAAVLLLGGCPKKTTTVAVETESAPNSFEVPEAAAPETAASGSSEAAAETAKPAPATEVAGAPDAHTPSKDELKGRWFALYGGVGPLAGTHTYENGHQIEFYENGVARWSLTGGNELSSSWNISSGEIVLNIDAPDKLSSDFKATPLGFGRDDEIGLTGSKMTSPGLVFRFTPKLDNKFLALMGRNGELMVYGRVDNGGPDKAPDASGTWQIVPAKGQVDEAQVTVQDGMLTAKWGPYKSNFEGRYTHGYFVGMVNSNGGNAYAAVMPAAGGGLDGVISTEPYREMSTSFDFTRQ